MRKFPPPDSIEKLDFEADPTVSICTAYRDLEDSEWTMQTRSEPKVVLTIHQLVSNRYSKASVVFYRSNIPKTQAFQSTD